MKLPALCLKMNLHHVALWPLLLLSSYVAADVLPSPFVNSSPSSLPTMLSSTLETSSESTSLLHPTPEPTSPPNSSLPQQNQTELWVSNHVQTESPELSKEEVNALPLKFSDPEMEDSGRSQQWEVAAGGVSIVLMKSKGQLGMGDPQGAAGHAMGLFLAGCSLLLCLFIGIYCAYSRGSKKEPFSHHRLYEEAFDDPALFLDNPKDYDWFFNETDSYVYPTPSQTQRKPIQILSVPALKQPSPLVETSPPKSADPEMGPNTKEQQQSTMKLECLSPSNLNLGNLI